MAAQNGTAVNLYVGSTLVAMGKSNSFNLSRALIDVSNKTSNGWKESIYGQGSGSFDFEGVFEEGASWGFEDAYTALTSKTVLTVKMASTTAGDAYYSANCLITSLKNTAPMEDAQTWSATFEITGAPSTGSVA
jgi:predicted secreted protein